MSANDELEEVMFEYSGRESIPSVVTHVRFHPSVVEVGVSNGAFSYCSSLMKVVLNDGLREIGECAFANCNSLQSINIPSTVTKSLVQRRGSEIFVLAAAMRFGSNWDTIKPVIDQVNELITYYEMKEATSLFELALWKFKLNQAKDSGINRDACRIAVPGPIKDVILQYLGWPSMKLRVD